MHIRQFWKAVCSGAFLLIFCTSCGEEPYYITFENLSGVGISEIHAVPDGQRNDTKNLLETTLADGDSVTVEVGRFAEDFVADGFYMEVYSEADRSFQTFDMLVVKNGGRVSFYMDSIELCAAVDTSHEEIQSMIADMEGAVID